MHCVRADQHTVSPLFWKLFGSNLRSFSFPARPSKTATHGVLAGIGLSRWAVWASGAGRRWKLLFYCLFIISALFFYSLAYSFFFKCTQVCNGLWLNPYIELQRWWQRASSRETSKLQCRFFISFNYKCKTSYQNSYLIHQKFTSKSELCFLNCRQKSELQWAVFEAERINIESVSTITILPSETKVEKPECVHLCCAGRYLVHHHHLKNHLRGRWNDLPRRMRRWNNVCILIYQIQSNFIFMYQLELNCVDLSNTIELQ